MLKNKFVKFLVILNGLMLPIVIGLIIYAFVDDFLRQSNNRLSDDDFLGTQKTVEKNFSIANNGPQKLYNSESWYMAFYRHYEDNDFDDYGTNQFPQDIVNIVFFDDNLKVKNTLLNKESLIINVSAPNKYSEENRLGVFKKKIFYLIVEKDTNSNSVLDKQDISFLYVSDLDGGNFNKIIEKNVDWYSFIDEDLILISYKENETIRYGVYNFLEKKFEISKSLNEIIEKYNKI